MANVKMIQPAQTVKTVDYHGLVLTIPANHNWIAFNKHGELFSYLARPLRLGEEWEIEFEDNGLLHLGRVESDIDWQDSLQYVGD